MARASDKIAVGRVTGLFGVRGWVKIYSYTEPRHGILRYSPWYLRVGETWHVHEVEDGRVHGRGVVVRLAGYDDRDAAAALVGADLSIEYRQLERLTPGEYYWTDLVGLDVVNAEGVNFGVVDHLLETGANDVLVVKGERERLIPYIPGRVIERVDAELGEIRVHWDPEF